MTIKVNIENGVLEQKLNKAITKMPESLRPRPFNPTSAKNKFVEEPIAYYIDGLSRDKVLWVTIMH